MNARAALLLTLLAPSLSSAQPEITLPPSEEPKPAVPRPEAMQLQRESQIEVPLSGDGHAGAATAIGGYGEITGTFTDNSDPSVVDIRRLVLFVGHNFTDKLRVYTELEMEHAVSSSGDQGEFEVEQAFLDYLALRQVNVRVGLIIMPIGIVNQYHEPPTFNGVDRPDTDTRIIPSTWREVGAGVFGALGPVRYQAYGVTGFKAIGFDAEGLREGHQEGQLARARSWAAVGRVDYQPRAWLDLGLSGYAGTAGQGDAVGTVPLLLAEADVRLKWKGLEVRAEFANVWIDGTAHLNQGRLSAGLADGSVDPAHLDAFQPVSHQLRGGYLEAGYNLLRPFQTRYQSTLNLFARYERTDTQADVNTSTLDAGGGERLTLKKVAGKDIQVVTVGLAFRPIAEVALKMDYQRKWAFGEAEVPTATWNQVNLGMAWMF